MRKFDIKKFFNELAKPEKRKKLNPNGNYPDEFGLNTKDHFYSLPSLEDALINAGYKELTMTEDDYGEDRKSVV